jgi:Tfp pilus assembly protein PilF
MLGVVSQEANSRRKTAIFAIGAIGLAAVLIIAAVVAPHRSAMAIKRYQPNTLTAVVATVPIKTTEQISAAAVLAADPSNIDGAVQMATQELTLARQTSDPRHLGRAQAILAPWWELSSPPASVLLLRATIRQSLHDFGRAMADVDQLITNQPTNLQAHMTRAVVATVTGQYDLARQSCVALNASPLLGAICASPLDAVAGDARGAAQRLRAALAVARTRNVDNAIIAWGQTTLCELLIMSGDVGAAESLLRQQVRLSPVDDYARATLADVLIVQNRFPDAAEVLKGKQQVDALLVRMAIVAVASNADNATELKAMIEAKIAAAAQRNDRIHLREEAMYALYVIADVRRAVKLAKDNWAVQKELADARLLAAAAVASDDRDAAELVSSWMAHNGVVDVQLASLAAALRQMTGGH